MRRRNKGIMGEAWAFLMERKAWWMIPIAVMLILAGVLIVFGESSALSPFIYALF